MVRIQNLNVFPTQTQTLILTNGTEGNNGNTSRIIVENCDNYLTSTIASTTNTQRNFGIWGNNINGVIGNWEATNYYYEAKTWGVNRGTGATLRCTGTITDTRVPLQIAPSTLKGIQVTPNANTGTVKMYVAFKSYVDMTLYGNRIKIDVESNITGLISTKTKKVTSSLIEGHIYDDVVSPWTEPGLIAKVYEIPFYTDFPSDPLDIRILFDWYDPNGYTYIDIQPELVV